MPKPTSLSPTKGKESKRQKGPKPLPPPSDATSDSEDAATPIEVTQTSETEVLSHAAQRRAKKRKLKELQEDNAGDTELKSHSKVQLGSNDKPALPTRQNSIWVGNLSFKTTEAQLKEFFAEAGEVSRIHMPKKAVVGQGRGMRGENRG